MKFDWDKEKAAFNEINHEVSFDEAATAFDDDFSLIFPDIWHSHEEERFILLGESASARLLVVVYTYRGNTIRLISAREATLRERKKYASENREK